MKTFLSINLNSFDLYNIGAILQLIMCYILLLSSGVKNFSSGDHILFNKSDDIEFMIESLLRNEKLSLASFHEMLILII